MGVACCTSIGPTAPAPLSRRTTSRARGSSCGPAGARAHRPRRPSLTRRALEANATDASPPQPITDAPPRTLRRLVAHAVARYLFRVIGPRRPVWTRPLRTVGTLIGVRAVADVPRVTQPVARAGVRAGAVALPGSYSRCGQEEAVREAPCHGCPSAIGAAPEACFAYLMCGSLIERVWARTKERWPLQRRTAKS